jgi:hypothetical protein
LLFNYLRVWFHSNAYAVAGRSQRDEAHHQHLHILEGILKAQYTRDTSFTSRPPSLTATAFAPAQPLVATLFTLYCLGASLTRHVAKSLLSGGVVA